MVLAKDAKIRIHRERKGLISVLFGTTVFLVAIVCYVLDRYAKVQTKMTISLSRVRERCGESSDYVKKIIF